MSLNSRLQNLHLDANVFNLPVLQQKHGGPEGLGVLCPGPGDHPDGVLRPLAADHEEGGPARPPELLADPEPLPPRAAVGRAEVVEPLLEPHLGRRRAAVPRVVAGRAAELPVPLARVGDVARLGLSLLWHRMRLRHLLHGDLDGRVGRRREGRD